MEPSPYPTFLPTLKPTPQPTSEPTPQPTSEPTKLTQKAFWANYLKLVVGGTVAVIAGVVLSIYYSFRFRREVKNMSKVTVLCKELLQLESINKSYRMQLKLPPRSIPPETWARMNADVTSEEMEEILEVMETLQVENSKLAERLQNRTLMKLEKGASIIDVTGENLSSQTLMTEENSTTTCVESLYRSSDPSLVMSTFFPSALSTVTSGLDNFVPKNWVPHVLPNTLPTAPLFRGESKEEQLERSAEGNFFML